jgi:uncharacterized membrane protein YphA (DoxX/SURF4 family)
MPISSVIMRQNCGRAKPGIASALGPTGLGAQKLFGTFGGHGLEGTSGFMEMLGLRPGRPWAFLSGLCEFGGGVLLTALGLLNPLGPMGVIASMTMATAKAHWRKPIWVTEGGAELPVTNTAISTGTRSGSAAPQSDQNSLPSHRAAYSRVDSNSELPRIHLPRTLVNKGKKRKGGGLASPINLRPGS